MMMRTSESLNEFAPAFVAFQAEVESAKKEGVNPFFKGSKYANLTSVWNAVRPYLVKHGLSVLQSPSFHDGRIVITTRILHKSGQWMEGDLQLKPVKDDPQAAGSAITYGRRYSLGSFLGVITEEDDDGNAASHSPKPPEGHKPLGENKEPKKEEAKKTEPPTFSRTNEKQMKWAYALLDKELPQEYPFHEDILKSLDGKPATDLYALIKEYK